MRKYTHVTKKLLLVAITLAMFISGCGEKGYAVRTGFLTDYANLQRQSESSLLYVNSDELAQYSNFIVDDIDTYFHTQAQTGQEQTQVKMTQQEIDDLTNYMQANIMNAITSSGKNVVFHPGRGVARIRISLSDMNRSLNTTLLASVKMLGIGVGGAAIEGEIIDSLTDKQVAAIVETQVGSNKAYTNLGKWGSTKEVMDEWAERFKKRLNGQKVVMSDY
jgi:hypothetical protein